MTSTMYRCWKCAGTGQLDWARHINNGLCYACKGAGETLGLHIEHSKGVHTLSIDGEVVWGFCPLVREPDLVRVAEAGEQPHWVNVQAVSGVGRGGMTHLRGPFSVEAARELYRRLAGGEAVDPDSIVEAEARAERAVPFSRNRPGVDRL